jgi:hypothetical protein
MRYHEIYGCWLQYIHDSSYSERIKWCTEQFGYRQDVLKTDFTWGYRHGTIFIKDEKFATLYILRWA